MTLGFCRGGISFCRALRVGKCWANYCLGKSIEKLWAPGCKEFCSGWGAGRFRLSGKTRRHSFKEPFTILEESSGMKDPERRPYSILKVPLRKKPAKSPQKGILKESYEPHPENP